MALLNLGYLDAEFAVTVTIGSIALFADSTDFLDDTTLKEKIAVPVVPALLPMSLTGLGMLAPGPISSTQPGSSS